MIDILKKKAQGYEVTEVTTEYAPDSDGNTRLVREKATTKHVPPDLAALKAYLELKESELNAMTDEQLEEEKKRLLLELAQNHTDAE